MKRSIGGNMITIYTFSHKRPDFLALQLQSFKKNIKDNFEFIVFNNANFDPNKHHYNEINQFCSHNNLTCIDIQKDPEIIDMGQSFENVPLFNGDGTYSNSCVACAYSLCYAWKHYISTTNHKICIIDSDMFVIHPIDPSDLLEKYQVCFVSQYRTDHVNNREIEYMWNGLVFVNLTTLPNKENINWWCGHIDQCPVDVGGQTYHYLQNHLDLNVLRIRCQHIQDDINVNFHPSNYELLWLDNYPVILHYRCGSNWNNKDQHYHNMKTLWLKQKLS
jgi:hypothetical protein